MLDSWLNFLVLIYWLSRIYYKAADETSIKLQLLIWLMKNHGNQWELIWLCDLSAYDKCHLAYFMAWAPDTVQKSQLIDRAVEQYMEVIDSVSLLI